MSNSVFQSVIVQLRDITDRSFGVIDTEGCVVSCTDMSILGERWTDAALKVSGAADSIVTFGQRSFKAILGNSNVLEYAVFLLRRRRDCPQLLPDGLYRPERCQDLL